MQYNDKKSTWDHKFCSLNHIILIKSFLLVAWCTCNFIRGSANVTWWVFALCIHYLKLVNCLNYSVIESTSKPFLFWRKKIYNTVLLSQLTYTSYHITTSINVWSEKMTREKVLKLKDLNNLNRASSDPYGASHLSITLCFHIHHRKCIKVFFCFQYFLQMFYRR